MQKRPAGLLICFLMALNSGFGQYYYKDLVTTKQAADLISRYKEQKVKTVRLQSFEGDGRPTEGFGGSQVTKNNYTQLITATSSPFGGSSELTSFFDRAGRLLRTVDTTDGSGSVTEYLYEGNRISKITSIATSRGQSKEKEVHEWQYTNERPVKMLRIKNGNDTTVVNFVADENGNIVEENSVRRGRELPSFYYYYNSDGRLTDIVSYSTKAKRLLPSHIFEYNDTGLIQSLILVPEGSDDYQKWIYSYNGAGLKTAEKCYNKKNQLLGRIEYQYSN